MAAVLAVGNGSRRAGDLVLDYWGAAVSHHSAASLWDLLPVADHPVDVIVLGDGGRAKRRGIRVHRSYTLMSTDVILRHGIPVTRPARTIADLSRATSQGWPGAVSAWELRKAIRQANVLGMPIDEKDRDPTRSDLEEDFLSLCRRHRIAAPEVNVWIGRYLVDFLWRGRQLIVETDGYIYHRGREAFQSDRGRDLELKRLGFEVLHLSERQVDEEAGRVAEVLRDRLNE
jgi:very-short-patch-repair endonuclease